MSRLTVARSLGKMVRNYTTEVLTDAPLLYWPMDEAAGVLAEDLSAGRRPGTHGPAVTITGADTFMQAPVVKYGNNGTATATTPVPAVVAAPPALSIEFWARKTADLNVNAAVWLSGDTATPTNNRLAQMHIGWTDGNIYWDCGTGVGPTGYDRINKIRDFTLTNWHHYVFLKNPVSGFMRIYVDGAQWHSGGGLTMPIGTQAGSSLLGNSQDYAIPFDGYICHFAVYGKELSAARVAAHYAAGAAKPL